MARIVSHIVRALAWSIVAAILVQLYFAGAFVFGVLSVNFHRALGVNLFFAAVFTALLSLTTRATRDRWKWHVGVVGIMIVQGELLHVRPYFPAVTALHAVNAVAVLLIAHQAARRAAGAPAARTAPRASRPSFEVRVA